MAPLSRVGLFHFAVFHQQVLNVRFTLNPSLHHLVQRTFGLYLVHKHRARVARLVLPDGAYRFPWFS